MNCGTAQTARRSTEHRAVLFCDGAPTNEESHTSRKVSAPLFALAALVGAGGLAACNTVEGAGEDIQIAGEAVEETAEELNDGNPETP